MGNKDEFGVTDEPFKELPSTGTHLSFDDHLSSLDGTDPAQNLGVLSPREAGSKAVPSRKELVEGDQADGELDVPVSFETDEDQDDTNVQVTHRQEPAPKKGKREEADDEADEYDNETDYLQKGLKLPDKSVPELIERMQGEQTQMVQALKSLYAQQGIQLYGNTPAEINTEIARYGQNQFNQGDQRPQRDPNTGRFKSEADDDAEFEGLSNKEIEGLLEEADVRADKETVKFYSKLSEKMYGPMAKAMKAQQQSMSYLAQQSIVSDFVTDRMLFDLAVEHLKAKGDDGPIPSFSQIRQLVSQNPRARAEALYRMMEFGDDNSNAFLAGIGQWRNQTNRVGLTNAQVDARRKVVRFSKETAGRRATSTRTNRQGGMAAEIAANRKLPVSVLERRP